MKAYALAALLLIPGAAAADDFNYNYLEGEYYQGEIDDFPYLEFDGQELRFSRACGNWLLLANYEQQALDPLVSGLGFRLEASERTMRLGGSYAWSLHERFAILPTIGLVQARSTTEGTIAPADEPIPFRSSRSDTGYFVSVGLRGRITNSLEAEFSHRFANVFSDRRNDWRLDLRYALTPGIALGVAWRDFEGDTATGVNFRWYY